MFWIKKIIRDKEGLYKRFKKKSIHKNIKMLSVSAPTNISKICETKMNEIKQRRRQIHNYTWRLQHSSLSNQVIKKENQYIYRSPEQHYQST